MRSKNVTVWVGLWVGGTAVGPYFYEKELYQFFTVNSEHYRSMLTKYYCLELDDLGTEDIWFQTDTMHKQFKSMIINCEGDIN